MGMTVVRWRTLYQDAMSLESILQHHPLQHRCSSSEHSYKPGERIKGFTRAGTCYLLDGSCQFSMHGEHALLRAQHFLEFQAGEYSLKVLSSDAAKLIFVWPISER